mmetsp:Transcript_52404/g.71546  ORF Transcript_52404/g.71546 Transcript_52404/m.71546 type:complete len:209 (+) Transcript_52404:288-914(+)
MARLEPLRVLPCDGLSCHEGEDRRKVEVRYRRGKGWVSRARKCLGFRRHWSLVCCGNAQVAPVSQFAPGRLCVFYRNETIGHVRERDRQGLWKEMLSHHDLEAGTSWHRRSGFFGGHFGGSCRVAYHRHIWGCGRLSELAEHYRDNDCRLRGNHGGELNWRHGTREIQNTHKRGGEFYQYTDWCFCWNIAHSIEDRSLILRGTSLRVS